MGQLAKLRPIVNRPSGIRPMIWQQNFNPLGNTWLSTMAAAFPVCTLIYFLAIRRVPAWRAAVYALLASVIVALAVFRMPAVMIAGAVADGLVFGWFRIAMDCGRRGVCL